MKTVYYYDGPVLDYFGDEICRRWKGETIAQSKGKATSNLMYRFKTTHAMQKSDKIQFLNDVKEK